MDLTIPLKGSTAGRQYAGWKPRAVAMQGMGNRALTGQHVPVGDGITLNADVYTPKTPGRYPAVLSFAAYSSEKHTAGIPTGTDEAGSPPVFTDRGYCSIIVERRGMGRSAGESVPFFDPRDVDDHEKVIAWAAGQPWCNGEVVLFGSSYYAITQLYVAARRPPALKAFFVHEVDTDNFRHSVQFGGVPGSYFLGVWTGANFTDEQDAARMSPNTRALISHVTNGAMHPLLEKVLHRNVDRMFSRFLGNTPSRNAAQLYASWMFDQKTREESTVGEVGREGLAAIDVPFVAVHNTGFFNIHQFGAYDLVEHAGTVASSKWLILGPPAYDLPVYEWQLEALAFFDHIVRGTDNGYADQPHVRYWVDGTDDFAAAGTFPPAGAEVRQLYLGSGGADHDTHRLTTEPPAEGRNSWVAVPPASRSCPVWASSRRRSCPSTCRSLRTSAWQARSPRSCRSAATRSTRTWSPGSAGSTPTAPRTCSRSGRSAPWLGPSTRHAARRSRSPWSPAAGNRSSPGSRSRSGSASPPARSCCVRARPCASTSRAGPTCSARAPARATPSSTCPCRPTCPATPCTSAGQLGRGDHGPRPAHDHEERHAMTTTYLPADDAGATPTRVGHARGLRYGEIILVGTDVTGHRTGSVYTTMGVEARSGSRDSCPQEIWDRIDPDALAEEHDALGAMKNGPRLWCLDWAEAMTGAERDFAGLRTHWAAKLDIANAQHKPQGAAYHPLSVERDARFGVDRGSTVYLLDDAGDRTWVLKSIDLCTHPDETYDGLAGLGGRLDLPRGWTFRSSVLDTDLVLAPENGCAQVVSDDRGNVYDRVGASFSNYRP